MPAVLGSLKENGLLAWNQAFRKEVGLSEDELTTANLTSLVKIDVTREGLAFAAQTTGQDEDFMPCKFTKARTNEGVPGFAIRFNDGMLLAVMAHPGADLAIESFNDGWVFGREEERSRTRRFFHDFLSSKMVLASFIAFEIYQKLESNGAAEAAEMGKVSKLLRESIEAIVQGYGEIYD